jgi:hypothetical protein
VVGIGIRRPRPGRDRGARQNTNKSREPYPTDPDPANRPGGDARHLPAQSASRSTSSGRIRAAARDRWEIAYFSAADHWPSVRPPGASEIGSKSGS